MKNNNDQYRLDLEALRAFENATWILTHKESGDIIECDYSVIQPLSQMSS